MLPGVQSKKNYSDADIVLSSDWVPPLTIAPTLFTDTLPNAQPSSLDSTGGGGTSLTSVGSAVVVGGRKKTSSVSFSVDDNSEQHSSGASSEKSGVTDNRKNKMLKRLSYPLTWVEGLTGDGKPNETESAPNTGDSNQSVFSKVFSR